MRCCLSKMEVDSTHTVAMASPEGRFVNSCLPLGGWVNINAS